MFWSIILALVVPYCAWEIAKQLYTATMEGYILTGRSMSTRVYRDKNRSLFRNNVVANIVVFPLVSAGGVLLVLDALQKLGLVD